MSSPFLILMGTPAARRSLSGVGLAWRSAHGSRFDALSPFGHYPEATPVGLIQVCAAPVLIASSCFVLPQHGARPRAMLTGAGWITFPAD